MICTLDAPHHGPTCRVVLFWCLLAKKEKKNGAIERGFRQFRRLKLRLRRPVLTSLLMTSQITHIAGQNMTADVGPMVTCWILSLDRRLVCWLKFYSSREPHRVRICMTLHLLLGGFPLVRYRVWWLIITQGVCLLIYEDVDKEKGKEERKESRNLVWCRHAAASWCWI